jgi:ubiquinone/menaquinone biosynthesis C-methylase UbiE
MSVVPGDYIMESPREIRRLELKTGFEAVQQQALWAGLKPGMRVADLGCGSGKTTSFLKRLAGSGEVVGVDRSAERLNYARQTYGEPGISFMERDLLGPLDDLGGFDFVWVRFLLEYHGSRMEEMTHRFSRLLNPGGILCLIDLDHNSLNHYGLSPRLDRAIRGCADALVCHGDFDPWAGRKLYSLLFDLGLKDIDVTLAAHHLIFGEVSEEENFNWITKVAVAGRECRYGFPEYPGGYEEFLKECQDFFNDPRRFTYTPLICCRGVNS